MENIKQLYAVCFSPTGGTEKVVQTVVTELEKLLEKSCRWINFTKSENRKKKYFFTEQDLVVFGFPVYAGRIPNKIEPDIRSAFTGKDTPMIPICVFGNRNYDEAVKELVSDLKKGGFIPLGAAAVVAQHAFSEIPGRGRPDAKDQEEIRAFIQEVWQKGKHREYLSFYPDSEIGSYYTPLKEDGTPAKFLKAKPVTNKEKCDNCGICAKVCPMDSIDKEAVSLVVGVCIKCQACIKKCPTGAKYWEDADFLSHVAMLEHTYYERKSNTFWME